MLQRVFTADFDPARLPAAVGPGEDLNASVWRGRPRWRRPVMRIGIVCPYTWDVPGGVQQHIRDLAEALIDAGPRGLGDLPGRRRHAAAGLRRARRPGGAGALQRVGRPALVRVPVREPGSAAGSRRATSTCCTCTSPSCAQPVAAGLLGRRRADRGHRSTPRSRAPALLHVDLPGAADRAGEDQRPDRRVRGGPHHAGRAHRRRRGAHPERGHRAQVREGRARCPAGPAPAARSASSAAWTSRARAWTCCYGVRDAGCRPARAAAADRGPGGRRATCSTGCPPPCGTGWCCSAR